MMRTGRYCGSPWRTSVSKDKYRSNTAWVIHPLASDQNFTGPAETSAQKDGGKIACCLEQAVGEKVAHLFCA